jgi:uncharacterized membrane protein
VRSMRTVTVGGEMLTSLFLLLLIMMVMMVRSMRTPAVTQG